MQGSTVEVGVWENTKGKEGHRKPLGTHESVGSLVLSESIPYTKVITELGLFASKAA